MTIKYKLISIIALILLVFLSINYVNNMHPLPNKINQQIKQTLIKTPKTNKSIHNNQATQKQQESTKQQSQEQELTKQALTNQKNHIELLAILLQRKKYSADPTIELLSSIIEYKNCSDLEHRFNGLDDRDLIQQLYDKLSKQCQFVLENTDILSNNHSDRKIKKLLQNDLFSSTARDTFMQILNNENKQEAKQEMFDFIVKSKNPQLLLVLKKTIDIPSFNAAIKDNINSNDKQYLKMLADEAIHIYSCQFQNGMTCTNTSKFILNKCSKDKILCGKNTDYWFNHYIYAGHKADIEIILNLLQTWN